eukprot:CAMPEP_0184293420 /NCGR_PEP_ID=MMETSP1049-20130417/4848_1 /TAXON_ID=77928 /ORGANISM="Proteomonas sulcata, Strain CCMP704" /LENGTH=270 /DNA_ID=CAMNT_0026601387 /DNA_START=38 /DNA_END=850 /DNA_ORIENTATION=-
MTQLNASLYTKDAQLATAAKSAKDKWMASESAYRTAQTSHDTAHDAATYASSQYKMYSTAVTTAQEEYDKMKPKYDEEKAQLSSEKPILIELKTMLAELLAPAAAKSNQKSILQQVDKVALRLMAPTTDKKLKNRVQNLRTKLAETTTDSTASTALGFINNLITEITARISEIDSELVDLSNSLTDNAAKQKEWEGKVVDLSDAADLAKNEMNTADLTRQKLGGEYTVINQSYEDNHATFLDESVKLAEEIHAINTILTKVDTLIAECSS